MMTPAEMISEHASRKATLADAQNHREFSANFAEIADGILNRAFGEHDKLSASLISRGESYAGLPSDKSGALAPAKSLGPVSSGGSPPAKSLRPSSMYVLSSGDFSTSPIMAPGAQ